MQNKHKAKYFDTKHFDHLWIPIKMITPQLIFQNLIV